MILSTRTNRPSPFTTLTDPRRIPPRRRDECRETERPVIHDVLHDADWALSEILDEMVVAARG